MAKFIPEMHEGSITCYSHKHFTKEEFIKMIESNFPDNETYENIVVALTTMKEHFKLLLLVKY